MLEENNDGKIKKNEAEEVIREEWIKPEFNPIPTEVTWAGEDDDVAPIPS